MEGKRKISVTFDRPLTEISIEEIVRKRDELLDESSEIYCAAPLTDGKSYAAAPSCSLKQMKSNSLRRRN